MRDVTIRWSSTGATKCTGGGPSFSTGDRTSGLDYSVREPNPGQSTSFRVTCNGPGGWITSKVKITTEGGNNNNNNNNPANQTPSLTLERQVSGGGSWGQGDVTIGTGEEVSLRWNTSNISTCTATGPGFTVSSYRGTDTTIIEPADGNSSTYTISCTGNFGDVTDSVTVTKREGPTATLERWVDSGPWSLSLIHISEPTRPY